MFCAETIAIISGSPSGTATTMMMTASITASTRSLTTTSQFEQYAMMRAISKPLWITRRWNIKAIAIATPPM